MKVRAIPSSWLNKNGRRLDCGPYLGGSVEARILLERLQVTKDRLSSLTAGGMAGLVNAGRIRRQWVSSKEYGVPFLTSSDILQADLSSLSFISNQAVRENPNLCINRDWTLITGSRGKLGGDT
jgi:type I restriction enzyme, S subunit